MLEIVRAWLNGKKDYYNGVAIYQQAGGNSALLELLKKGATDYTVKRLRAELLEICNELKAKEQAQPPASLTLQQLKKRQVQAEKVVSIVESAHGVVQSLAPLDKNLPSAAATPVNEALFQSCKQAADRKYKEVMNTRAVLFSLAKAEDFEDANTPDRVNARVKLALEVVTGYHQLSTLYNQLDYVREHGVLPSTITSQEDNEYDHLPDPLVKQTLDNLRKNYNKMKKREQTPERVALLQKHEANIKKLEERWQSLKPQC